MKLRTLLCAALLLAFSLPTYAIMLPVSPWKSQNLTHPEATVLALRAYRGFQLVQTLKSGAQSGNPNAMLGLVFYYDHTGEFSKAVLWARKAAHAGNPQGERRLGSAYYHGRGIPKNMKKAVYWTEKAAQHGVPQSQYLLAYMHQNGEGYPKNTQAAIPLYVEATQNGSLPAAFALGKIYKDGDGVPKNEKLAHYWGNYVPKGGWSNSGLESAYATYHRYQHQGKPLSVAEQKKVQSREHSVLREFFGFFYGLLALLMALQARKSWKHPEGSSAIYWGVLSLVQLSYLQLYILEAADKKSEALWLYGLFYGIAFVMSGIITWAAVFRKGKKTPQALGSDVEGART